MIFLIDYDRVAGKLVSIRLFEEVERGSAQAARLQLELDHHRAGVEREVVLLEAVDETAIRRTHRRYFDELPELLRALNGDGDASR
jgi:hypothetical protein